MAASSPSFDEAVMGTLDTLDNSVVDEYDNDQFEILEGDSDEDEEVAEELAYELFGESNRDDEGVDESDHVSNDCGFSGGTGAHFEVGQSSQALEEAFGSGLPEYLDYPAFNDTSYWLNVGLEMPLLNPNYDEDDFYKGQLFATKEDAIHASQLYSIKNRVEYRVAKSNPELLSLKCRRHGEEGVNCKWHLRVYLKKRSLMFVVSVYKGPHTCESDIIPNDNVHLNRSFIGFEMMDFVKENLRISPAQIVNHFKKHYGYEISYLKAWKGRQKAMENLFGNWDESFEILPAYMRMLQRSNPGTVVRWCTTAAGDSTVTIDRVFWAFAPAIEGFKHCRPLLSIDGTHLYGKWKGTLLVAVSLDAQNQVFPIAYALVESENNDSWDWFMSTIRTDVTDRDELCVVSDRHAGILKAMSTPEWSPPRAHHRVCIRHFQSNFMSKVHCKKLKAELGSIAYQKQPAAFELKFRKLQRILRGNEQATQWLHETPKDKWAFAYDEAGRRWGSMTTNASEVFNWVLKGGRDLPITALVHYTLKRSNKYFTERRAKFADHDKPFTPLIEDHITDMVNESSTHEVTIYNHSCHVGEVRIRRSKVVETVNLQSGTCTCGSWQLLHYPCSHVVAMCTKAHLNKYSGVASTYSMDAYRRTWAPSFFPVSDRAYWGEWTGIRHIANPQFKRHPRRGRDQSRRRRNEMDGVGHRAGGGSSSATVRRQNICGYCRVPGHNRASCELRINVESRGNL